MAILPLAPGAFRSTNAARMLTETRAGLDDLQRQLASGKKSETFGGLGVQRITTLEMRAKQSEIRGFQATITLSQIRAKQIDLGLSQLGKIGDEVRSASILPQYNPGASGYSSMQSYARTRLDEAVDVLNTEINGVRLFSGRKTDVRPVVDTTTMIEGDAAGRAGLKQMVAERKAADFGVAPNVGRVAVGGAGTIATMTEDGAHPFGIKLTAATSTSPGIAAVQVPGPPASVSFNLTANPADGEEVRIALRYPDGSTQNVSLKAQAAPMVPPANAAAFEIGGTPAATAANLRQAITDLMARESVTTLPAASAKAAGAAFFAGSESAPPMRVVGPPATATALAAGTSANTIIWYRGDDQSLAARQTQVAKIDTSITVGLGVQANEQGIQRLMVNLAVFATETFSASDPNDQGRYQSLLDRVRSDLGQTTGVQRVQDIQMEIALSATAMKQATERHNTRLAFVETVIADVENTSQEETAAKLLSLQTKLQAAYQTTAIIGRLNLTEYLR